MTDAGSGDRFFELARDLLAVVGRDGRFTRVNPAWLPVLGHAPEDLVGRRYLEFVTPEHLDRATAAAQATLEGTGPESIELSVRTAAGETKLLALTLAFDHGEQLLYLIGRDVTASRAAADRLRESEERYRELFESHPVPMAVWDPATMRILAANDAALRQYGYARDELLDLTIDRIVHAEDWADLLDSVDRFVPGILGGARFRHRRKNGSVFEVEVTGHDLEYAGRPARLVMAIDVSERRRLEEQLRQAHKMEAIGRLAGGVAHDFNNILTAISGYSELLLGTLAHDDTRREDVAHIHRAAARASGLTRQLLAFSRRQLLRPELLDLNAVLIGIVPMLRRLIGEHIELRVEPDADPAFVLADTSGLEQSVVNLAINARDAMPGGGTLTLTTSNAVVGEREAGRTEGLIAGSHVVLAVTDTGVGMDPGTTAQVFDPFFTTKGLGEGTGLGLATVYGTVQQSGGAIRVSSEPGKGTSFRIYLPLAIRDEAVDGGAEGSGDTDRRKAARPAVSGEGVTVLLVEDEPAVRTLVEQILTRRGYEVIVAADGDQAIAQAAAHRGRIRVLVTDVVMPGIGGVELARRLTAGDPLLKVILMSGYTDESSIQNGITDPGVRFVSKPFTADALLTQVESVLGDAAGEAARR